MQQLLLLYKKTFGRAPKTIEQLPKAGSNREYVRLTDAEGASVIGVIGPDKKENACFVYLSRHFSAKQLPVPQILATDEEGMRYLQTDLGHTSLYQALSNGRKNGGAYDDEEVALIRRTMRALAHLQVNGAEGLDFEECIPPTHFDEQAVMFDLNYFKYCFLKVCDMAFDEVRLQADLQQLATDLTQSDTACCTFLYRDFQARNVMLGEDGSPYFIDYQGGLCGPLQYDVASFLWQASAQYPQTLREEMINEYLDELTQLVRVDTEEFRHRLQLFVLFRILQVLGAYGLRGYFERKKYFLDSIPAAIRNLRRQLLDGVCQPYTYLEETLQRLVALPRFNTPVLQQQESELPTTEQPRLVVRVGSFSYKKGLPDDPSGNGGGYIFDCRSTHNPGRYEPYKQLTGLDEPVIRFLEDDGEILSFLDSVYKLADTHTARYIERGFTHLMFHFGCTGGQHRSVYCAEHLAEHLHSKFGIEVQLEHREQGIRRVLK